MFFQSKFCNFDFTVDYNFCFTKRHDFHCPVSVELTNCPLSTDHGAPLLQGEGKENIRYFVFDWKYLCFKKSLTVIWSAARGTNILCVKVRFFLLFFFLLNIWYYIFLKTVLKCPLTEANFSNALFKLVFQRKCMQFGCVIIEVKTSLMIFFNFLKVF